MDDHTCGPGDNAPVKIYKYPDDWTDADTEAEAEADEVERTITVRLSDGMLRTFIYDDDNLETWE